MGRLICFLLLTTFVLSFKAEAQWKQISSIDSTIFYLDYDDNLLAFGKEWVYLLGNGDWTKCCRLRGHKVGIFDVDAYKGKRLWATTIGLFECYCGKPAERIFLPSDKQVFAISVGPWGGFVGTSDGLYFLKDRRATKLLATDEVRDILVISAKSLVFVLTKSRVYLYDYVTHTIQYQKNINVTQDWLGAGHRSVAVQGKVFFSCGHQVYSLDVEKRELKLSFDYPGVIMCLTKLGDRLLVGGSGGVYMLGEEWERADEGLGGTKLIDMISTGDRVYGTDGQSIFVFTLGVEKIVSGDYSSVSLEKIWEMFSWEPDILLLQRKAMEYAELHPDKIRDWKRRVKIRGWLPKLSLGMDLDNNKTVSDSVAVASSGAENVGPDDKSVYKALNFNISLQWNLSDLIWSSEEIDIDTRSKLTVELRDDILDQINQLYFERRRYQVELILKPPKSLSEAIKKLLKIDRLRADIDALTGGFLTDYLRTNGHLGWEMEFIRKVIGNGKEN